MSTLHSTQGMALSEVEIDGVLYYKIAQVNQMRTFFMSIVSDSNHWLFVASNGGIAAGRKNADFALFPYYTDDKLVENAENTGSKTILRIHAGEKNYLWEPFSLRTEALYSCTRNLYKSKYGNAIIFEEINETLGVSFRYAWHSSNIYGFVRKAVLTNLHADEVEIEILDGLQNILPYGVGADLQTRTSNLADAYKRSELLAKAGLGIFALSAIIVDKAEPSEALKANVVWALGMQNATVLLSALQLNAYRQGKSVQQETDVKGERGCYFLVSSCRLSEGQSKEWLIVANVNQTHAAVWQLAENLEHNDLLSQKVEEDIQEGTQQLIRMVAAADGLQVTSDGLRDTRHFSNVLFNIMRGGIFDDNYRIEKWDFEKYLYKANPGLFAEVQLMLGELPAVFTVQELAGLSVKINHIDFSRLATEYLPLKFSRRHGDPSRPWNQFSINIRSEIDGSKILDYQGNWRDIFQNWEALALAYPGFLEGMIYKFLNASTFDGYNPYRVTKDGFDWETIEPDNPWSYIGYWGDHQIIYLLKFFEWQEKHNPGALTQWMAKSGFVYAHVPYRIKSYAQILDNPKDTIEFDEAADHAIRKRMLVHGADGALLTTADGNVLHVTFLEKILATVLAKLSNLIPDGGIWMNTQRPEWNDANNALVGNGLSMVTLCYLRRFLTFFEGVLVQQPATEVSVSVELSVFLETIHATLAVHSKGLQEGISDATRKKIMDALGTAGSVYRTEIYNHGYSGTKRTAYISTVLECFQLANAFLENAIVNNKRKDNLYHTYNLLSYDDNSATLSHLSEMLEGQVAVLSSGFLAPEQSLALLDALRASALYRQDQYSYILYPNKELPGFLEKNNIPDALVTGNSLVEKLLADGDASIVEKDIYGHLHFNGNFRNAGDLKQALATLSPVYQPLVADYGTQLLNCFEEVFRHKEFTGRSGTFYGYEGLGSIYWHMVSKLLLAVQETCMRAISQHAPEHIVHALVQHYYQINEGIGVHKPAELYGAFPTDPYSHTPIGKGAQQPGMTGQVKEDILCRMGELGLHIENGQVSFAPHLLRKSEFASQEKIVTYTDVSGHEKTVQLAPGSLFFTYCQVPVVYILHTEKGLQLTHSDGTITKRDEHRLSVEESKAVWSRSGSVSMIIVILSEQAVTD